MEASKWSFPDTNPDTGRCRVPAHSLYTVLRASLSQRVLLQLTRAKDHETAKKVCLAASGQARALDRAVLRRRHVLFLSVKCTLG